MMVYLIGMPASGKTTIGKQVAKKANFTFIDLDDVISTKEEVSIKQIFQEKGEAYFREIESKYLKEVSQTKTNTVISLGGGTPCYYDNIDVILSSGKVFYINAPDYVIVSRIMRGVTKRPLFANLNEDELRDKVFQLVKEREPFYLKAHHQIDAKTRSKKDIVEEIISHIKKS
jgi:shikimate kinase